MKYILERFQENVRSGPDKPFLYDDEHPRGVSFRRFDDLSARIYAWLKKQGIGREDFVLINLRRGVMPYAAAVGVWKAGAAFVIVEENYAPERVAYIREDCGCRAELNGDSLAEALNTAPLEGWEQTDPHDAAFAVYTSGATGKPKGVLHEYGNLERCVESLRLEGNPMLRGGIFRTFSSPQTFVAAIIGLLGVMSAEHGRMYIVSYATAKNPDAYMKLFEQYRFNTMFLSPSYARVLGPRMAPWLNTLAVGSEPANGLSIPGVELLNFYASSESLFLISVFRLDRAYDPAPVGKPAFPLTIRLLDEEGNEVPNGEIGEIVYDTPYFRGYIHLPEETAAVLRDGWFHSGDLGRKDEEGNLILLGRAGEMVKINGNRVEPGEIETVFKKLTHTGWAAARAIADDTGKVHVCVYYTDDIRIDPEDIRKRMMEYLPYYMIPSHFIRIDTIPLLPNGKLNRKALPTPDPEAFRREYTAPANETEAAICSGMEKVLDIRPIGATDDFYELGGDSIRAIHLVVECGLKDLNVGDVFRGRTPEKIARIFLEARGTDPGISLKERNARAMARPQPLTPEQLFMLDVQLYTPISTMYNLFTVLQVEKKRIDLQRMASAVGKAIRNHASLLTVLFFNEDGEAMQRYMPELFEEIQVERISEAEFQRMKDELVQPYHLINQRLYRCRLFETETNAYIFFDVHHILFDGKSFHTLMLDIIAAYNDQPLTEDLYYLTLEKRNEEKKGPQYQESRAYFEKRYGGVQWIGSPPTDRKTRENRLGQIERMIPVPMEELKKAEDRFRVSRNEFLLGAVALAMAIECHASDILMSWVYSGRDDVSLLSTTGLLFRELPIGLRLGQIQDLDGLYREVESQVRGGIIHHSYPYMDRADMVRKACVLYQMILGDDIVRNGVVYHPIEIRQNFAASQTILDIMFMDGQRGFRLEMDYIASLYDEETIERLGRTIVAVIRRLTEAGEKTAIREILASCGGNR